MTIALDIGAHACRSLRCGEGELIGRSVRSAYLTQLNSDEKRELLARSDVKFGTCEEHLIILGDDAVKWSRMLQVPYTPLLAGGTIPEGDPLARQICGQIIEALLPEPDHAGETCAISLPTAVAGRPASSNHEAQFVERIVSLRGYRPLFVRPGRGVLLAEAGDHSFTGLALHAGASGCELILGHCGREMASFVLPLGGNWIDEQIAKDRKTVVWDARGRRYLDLQQAAKLREDYFGTGEDDFGKQLRRHSAQLLSMLFSRAGEAWRSERRLAGFSQPLSLYCGGGLMNAAMFPELVREALQTAALPLTIRDLHFVEDVPYAITRGALIAAELESGAGQMQAVA